MNQYSHQGLDRPQGSEAEQDVCEDSDCSADSAVQRWLCTTCDCTFCDICWDRQASHKRGKRGQQGRPHEKTDKRVFERLRSIFDPPEDQQELALLHFKDEETLWFGVEHIEGDKCRFRNTGRSAALIAATKKFGATDRYPLLISFVGQTGAGKSTLIKILVDLQKPDLYIKKDLFKSPIAGSAKDDRSPTSGDVHLYIDPRTAFDDLPVLYADCEGLEGGENPPRANQLKEIAPKVINFDPDKAAQDRTHEFKLNTSISDRGARETAVREIYPRILYTFSDVVVFVLRETRTFESVALKLLLQWASTSIESSVNQPVLPYVIIVLNATSNKIDDEEWDVKTATDRLLDHNANAVHLDPLKQYTEKWTKKGRTVRNTRDLIKCYYTDVRVVRVPTSGRFMLIKEQVDKLYLELAQACTHSFKAKLEARQSYTAPEFNLYLQAAIDHFTSRPKEPFNFVDVALKLNPLPQSFTGHLFRLAFAATPRDPHGYMKDEIKTLNKLSSLIASYILLDCIRYRRRGKPEILFEKHYRPACAAAIDLFSSLHFRCTYKSRKGKLCVNTRLAHRKGHQDEKGKIIGDGKFESTIGTEDFIQEWLERTRASYIEHEKTLQRTCAEARNVMIADSDKVAHELHRSNLIRFFENHVKKIESRYTCYGCLMEVPQHVLPCKHMLCTACVKMLGRITDKNTYTVDYCHFETRASQNAASNSSTRVSIRFKPEFAGIRILSLDGGGMRGIVELECLHAIEKVLGNGLPVQAFFDLMVGTSTGGIVALGLGVKRWSVNQCIAQFAQVCDKAFVAWHTSNMKGLRSLTMLAKKSKYRTKPLLKVLHQVFGSDKFFGQVAETSVAQDTLVCVTATSGDGHMGIAMGNYVRQSGDEHWYEFQANEGMEAWQAAAATSAAPSFFRKFVYEIKGANNLTVEKRDFMDGAVYFNNPVRVGYSESRFIWPDMADNPPDLVLSIGTGKNGSSLDAQIQKELYLPPADQKLPFCMPDGKLAWFTSLKARLSPDETKNVLAKLIEIVKNRIDSILDAEREFKLFEADVVHRSGAEGPERYIRLNPDLRESPPALDATSQLRPLQEKVKRLLRSSINELLIERIAYRMVASTFYFAKNNDFERDESSGVFIFTGRIACRFEGSGGEMKELMRNLGDFIRRQTSAVFRPYFTVKEKIDDSDVHKIEISREAVKDMIDSAHYHIAEDVRIIVPNRQAATNIYICLCPNSTNEPELYPLSGFPRLLVTEEDTTAARLQRRAEAIKTKIKSTPTAASGSLLKLVNGNSSESRIKTEQDTDQTSLSASSNTNTEAGSQNVSKQTSEAKSDADATPTEVLSREPSITTSSLSSRTKAASIKSTGSGAGQTVTNVLEKSLSASNVTAPLSPQELLLEDEYWRDGPDTEEQEPLLDEKHLKEIEDELKADQYDSDSDSDGPP